MAEVVRVVEADWNWTVGESITLGLIGLALLAVLLLAYFWDRVTQWWRRRSGGGSGRA